MRRSDWLLAQLPMGMLDDDFFVRFVSIFQEVAGTVLETADSLEHQVDVSVAPPEMVRFLGGWIGVDIVDPSLDVDLQRRIVRRSGTMLRWRGTRRGMVELLELLSGGPAEVHDSGGVYRQGQAPDNLGPLRMSVESTGWLDPADFVAVVRGELPAHVSFELDVGGQRVWPADGPSDRPRDPGPGGPVLPATRPAEVVTVEGVASLTASAGNGDDVAVPAPEEPTKEEPVPAESPDEPARGEAVHEPEREPGGPGSGSAPGEAGDQREELEGGER